MAQNKYLDYEGLKKYHSLSEALMDEKDAAVLAAAHQAVNDAADNYEAAGSVATTKQELEAEIAAVQGEVDANETALAEEVARAKAAEEANANAASNAKAAADAAQADVDALEERVGVVEGDVGTLDNLSTSAKGDLVSAINEVRASVSAGGTAAAVSLDTSSTSEGALKSYTLYQGETKIGVIDIPKDMVVEFGEVVTNPEGLEEGTYIMLVLANVPDPLYINVGTLVDIYKAKASASQVQIAIDSSTREISATIVSGSIGTAELADDAVTTVKIVDANVTKAKLSTAVQASLDKADAAAPQTALDVEIDRAKAAEAQTLTDSKAYTDAQLAIEVARAQGVEEGLEERLADAETKLGTGDETVDEKISSAKQDAINTAAADASTKSNQALTDAKAYTNTEVAKTNTNVTANADAIAALEAKVGDGMVAIETSEIDALFAE